MGGGFSERGVLVLDGEPGRNPQFLRAPTSGRLAGFRFEAGDQHGFEEQGPSLPKIRSKAPSAESD